MYPPMGHPSQQTGYVGLGTLCSHLLQSGRGWALHLSKTIFVNSLQETAFLYLPFLGWVRTISPISALEFMELASFTRDN